MDVYNHHISLITQDATKNIQFYTQVLGLRLIKNSINQNSPHRRHIYYGDFVGSPGTVVTFFPVDFHGRQRIDQGNYYNGLDFNVPTGSLPYWYNRLKKYQVPAEAFDGSIRLTDGDGVTIHLYESTRQRLNEWTINRLTDVPMDKQIIGIRGTQMVVQNPATTAEFFEQLFGLDVIDNRVLIGQDQYLQIIQADLADPKLQWGPGGIDHFALGVTSSTVLEAIWAKAAELGYQQEFRANRGYFNSIYFRDPNDNRVEVATNGPGFTLDESIETLGSTFALPPEFEGRRPELTDYFDRHGVKFDDVAPADLASRPAF